MAGEAEGGYLETYATYARRYRKGERSVKRWAALGREKKDPCPLDEPGKLRDWWERNMTHKVPDGILAACAETGDLLELPKVVPVPEKAAAPVPEVPSVPRELVALGDDERGIFKELKRAEERSFQAHKAWEAEMAKPEPSEERLAFYTRQCTSAAEAVRKIQKDATEEAIRMRDYVPKLEAERLAGEFMQDLWSRMRGMGEGMARALGVTFTPAVEARWMGELDALCEGMQREVFSEEASA